MKLNEIGYLNYYGETMIMKKQCTFLSKSGKLCPKKADKVGMLLYLCNYYLPLVKSPKDLQEHYHLDQDDLIT